MRRSGLTWSVLIVNLLACWLTSLVGQTAGIPSTAPATEAAEVPARATPLEAGAEAPFTGDLLPAGNLQTLLERYVRLRAERDKLWAELEGERARAPALERLAEAKGVVEERGRQQQERAALEGRLRAAEVERDSARERVKWFEKQYEAATAWYRQPMAVSGLTVAVLVLAAAGTLVGVNFFLRLTDYYLTPPKAQ